MKRQNVVIMVSAIGMMFLFLGLVQATLWEVSALNFAPEIFAFGNGSKAMNFAMSCWVVGAVILIVPPAIEGLKLLVVLEVFLAVSTLMGFWTPRAMASKLVVRVLISIAILVYLKRQRFCTFTWQTVQKLAFWWTLVRKPNDNTFVLALELLGLGYALVSAELLTLGSLLLFWCSLYKWMGDRTKTIHLLWAAINFGYVVSGVIVFLFGR